MTWKTIVCPVLVALSAACYYEEAPPHLDEDCPTTPVLSPPREEPPRPTDPRPDAGARDAGARDGAAARACPGPTVDRWKELVIVDPSVVGDGRARNDGQGGRWSFRRRVEDLAGAPLASELAYGWLAQWRTLTSVSVAPGVPGAPRAAVVPRPGVDGQLLCPWLRATPANGCNATCTSCTDRRLDLAAAPFRLIAIVNRIDLGAAAGPCGRDGGELRFVYTAVAPQTGMPLPFTAIFEYQVALPAGEDRRSWAAAWRELSRLPFGATYNARLEAVVAKGLAGATLRRVQTNEVAFGEAQGEPWELRQFVPNVGERGAVLLEQTAVPHTPRLSLNNSSELGEWVRDNRRPILEGDNLLRADMVAGTALLPYAGFTWSAPGADAANMEAFNRNTCNGCHGGRAAGEMGFQHIGPATGGGYYAGTPGPARISRFLDDPAGRDELDGRSELLEATACGACNAYETR